MRGTRQGDQRGANLVEFALVAPFLILLLVGIIELAWLFSQDLTLKHGAREGARLAAVGFGSSTSDLSTETVARMNIATSPAVSFCVKPALVSPSGVVDPGDGIEVTVSQARQSLTGLIDWAFPPTFMNLSSTVEIRAEQSPSGYWAGTAICP